MKKGLILGEGKLSGKLRYGVGIISAVVERSVRNSEAMIMSHVSFEWREKKDKLNRE